MANLKVVPRSPDEPRPSRRRKAFKPGDVIADKYTLIEELGEGGMGVVWIAHNTILDVAVAVKLMSLEAESDALLRDRLLQEARASARIAHPAICRTLDYGTTDSGTPFVVMELLRGQTLASTLAPGVRIPAPSAVQMLLPIINGLGVAHALGVVHRDVKPENVFLARDQFGRVQPKLLDFGIARLVQVESKLTLEGAALGTPDYMSPEQARGDADIDFRTDVWSVAVVLYEMITGRVPFDGENYNKLMWAIQNESPVSTVELAAGDDALWTVLQQGLAKDRLERWASMHELGEALALWLFERGVREDVCGASLRSTWLEAGLSGVKLEVSSIAPPPGPESASKLTLSPSQVRKRATPEPTAVDELLAQTDVSERDAKTVERPPKRRGAGLWMLPLVLALGVAGYLTVRALRPPPPEPPRAALAEPAIPSPPPRAAEPTPAEPPPEPKPTQVEDLPPPEATASAMPDDAADHAPAGTPRPAKPKRAAAKVTAPSKAKQPRAVDFGF
jgi:serine/threonine protein kinase